MNVSIISSTTTILGYYIMKTFLFTNVIVSSSAFTIPSPLLSTQIIPRDLTSTTTRLQMSLEPLAKEGAWTAYLDDENTGLVYYFNSDTGESLWEPPTATFPKVKIPRRKEAKMEKLQKNYNQKYSDSFTAEGGSGSSSTDGGFFTSLFSPRDADATAKATSQDVESQAQDEVPFFNFFGANNNQNQQSTIKENETYSDESAVTANNANSFLNSFFGQPKNNMNSEVFDMVDQEEEEEFYDQSLYEDAVLVKDEEETITPIKLEIASKVIPHPEKISWGGEDALFVAGKSFGVFDGVSGATKLDGVPLYSNTLANKLKVSVGKKGLTVEEIKEKMLKAAEYADMAATGASTAVVASVGDDDILRAVNVGDSVLMIIRDGKVKARVKETIHYFDCPYQLSDESPDRPKNGSILQQQLQKGDIIIAGSDGVFDNLNDIEIIDIVDRNNKGNISKLAQDIVSESRRVSKDPNAATPYAKAAKRNNYPDYRDGVGGKLDDISCVVVRCK